MDTPMKGGKDSDVRTARPRRAFRSVVRETLMDFVQRVRPDFRTKLHLALDIAQEVNDLHHLDIIANSIFAWRILVNTQNDPTNPYSAQLPPVAWSETTVSELGATTKSSQLWGTPPKFAAGRLNNPTKFTDAFAFGTLLYYLVTETNIYGETTVAYDQFVRNLGRVEVGEVFMSEIYVIPDTAPPRIRVLINTLWHRNPVRRDLFREFLPELQGIVQELSAPQIPPRSPPIKRQRLDPHPGTVDDVLRLLRVIELDEYNTAFRENQIDMPAFVELTEADLKEMGVIPIGHRKRIVRKIREIKAE